MGLCILCISEAQSKCVAGALQGLAEKSPSFPIKIYGNFLFFRFQMVMNSPLVFSPYAPSNKDTVYRDILPHRSRSGKTVFVTWRLSDSLPAEVELHKSIRNAQKNWLKQKSLHYCPWRQDVESILAKKHPEYFSQYVRIPFWVKEQFDQRQIGMCPFRYVEAIHAVRSAVEEERNWGLEVGDGVICYNHVHLLIVPRESKQFKQHMQRIKGRASRYLGCLGISDLPKPVWQRYWFDHIVRSMHKLKKIRDYISDHPVPVTAAKWSAEWVEETTP